MTRKRLYNGKRTLRVLRLLDEEDSWLSVAEISVLLGNVVGNDQRRPIYAALNRLIKLGLATSADGGVTCYRITPEGREYLRQHDTQKEAA